MDVCFVLRARAHVGVMLSCWWGSRTVTLPPPVIVAILLSCISATPQAHHYPLCTFLKENVEWLASSMDQQVVLFMRWAQAAILRKKLLFMSFNLSTNTPSIPCLFIISEHTSHFEPSALDLCVVSNIQILCLPAHTSHLLQVADQTVILPCKNDWKSHAKHTV